MGFAAVPDQRLTTNDPGSEDALEATSTQIIIRVVREFFYGVILGVAAMYCFEYFDAPGVLAYLNSATQSAVQSTHGYSR